ncbi:RNA-guided endonuclease InsQ/TnpB family protein [Thermococcus nautili]|nr:RNA-guided endonuclease TnpB family protein [Thermococcus nautili]CAI1492663.1 transposase [Thermococcus nautili]
MRTSVAVNRIWVGQRPIHPTDIPLGIINTNYMQTLINFVVVVIIMCGIKLTQTFKLMKPNKRKRELLDATIERFKECVNAWISEIEQLGEYPTRKNVHSFAYKKIREQFKDLHSNVVQEAMNRAIEVYRAWLKTKGQKPVFTADVVSFKNVDVKIDRHFINVPLINKERVWLPMHVPKKLRKFLKMKHGRVQISKVDDEYYAQISFEVPEPKPYEPKGWLGVDIGINHIVVISDDKGKINKFYDNAIAWKKSVEYRRARLQFLKDKRTKKGAWRILKRLSHKEKNKMAYINHKIAKEIVELAKHYHYGIAIENLKGIRHHYNAKRHRKRLHKWAYGDLIDKIVYKAKLNGVPVVFVDPRNTSRTCSKCGYLVEKGVKGRWFRCPKCGFQLDRDLNAARNIAKRAFRLAPWGASSSQRRW